MDQPLLTVLERLRAAARNLTDDEAQAIESYIRNGGGLGVSGVCNKVADELGKSGDEVRRAIQRGLDKIAEELRTMGHCTNIAPTTGTNVNGGSPTGLANPVTLSPETLEWVRRQFSEEDLVAGLREIRETGGLELCDFIQELEQAAGPDE
jgi:hypothetical protein